MTIEVKEWTIQDLINKKSQINPKPQYQRTFVWSLAKQQLLIDSILRGYDLPKFYLRETLNDLSYSYEVTDGQQRMKAIWAFYESIFSLADFVIDNFNTRGIKIENLQNDDNGLLGKILGFKLNIAIIKDATQEEIRTLFARLQMGERLNPVELRHAMPSNFGNVVVALVENHIFFNNCNIPETRYKHQDYLDNALTVSFYDCQRSVKATDMRFLYQELSNSTIDTLQPTLLKCNKVLDWMEKINQYKRGIFRNKWTFVDVFYLLYKNYFSILSIHPMSFADELTNFERKRKLNNKNPELLIDDKGSLDYDKDMYDYIQAFNRGGAEKNNLRIRHRVFNNVFLKNQYIEINTNS